MNRRRYIVTAALVFFCVLLCTSSAFALRELGNNPFHHSALSSEAEVRQMLLDNKDDVKIGLNAAGNGELYEPLYAQLEKSEMSAELYAPGKKFDWMFYRKKGKGPVRVDKDVVWEGKEPMRGYSFPVDIDDKRYTMLVAPACGNLALAGVGPVPVAVAPVIQPAETTGEAPGGAPGTGDAPQQLDEAVVDSESGFPLLFDLGYLHQLDPAHYLIFRVGLEYYLTDSVSLIGMVGAAPHIDGTDGESAFVVDVFANYNFSRFWIGLGLGAWLTSGDSDIDAEDSDLDVIFNMGARLFGEPDQFNTSLFVEARSGVDELDEFDYFGRFGLGLRFRF